MTTGSVRVFEPHKPSDDDIRQAKNMAPDECPRRYCWWWHSLRFDWNVPVHVGCTFLDSPKPKGFKNVDLPCKRMTEMGSTDHYLAREPHLIEDGMDVHRFDS